MSNLITVKQLPVLEEQFKAVGTEIDKTVKRCQDMIVTDDNYKDIKKIRAGLNKESKEYADQFKAVKEQVLEPWNVVEDAYKENVKEKYSAADNALRIKINEVEDGLKESKKAEVEKYFNEYAESISAGFLTWDDTKIKVGMSDSMKSLKDRAKEFADRVVSDIALIDTQEYKAEIKTEYIKDLNVSRAITSVTERHKAIAEQEEKEKARDAVKAQMQQHEKEVESHLSAPVKEAVQEEKEPEQFIAFKVFGNTAQLMKVVEFLQNSNYKYEQVDL